ncbi:MAG: MFS transporter [Eubacteriaceae bacterium]|nr:MFS transporter [Eubacteriaceae bacterium]
MAWAALCTTIPSFFDFALSPFYGAIIELVKPMKYGKYRSWLILTTPFVLITYPMQYTNWGSPTTSAIVIIVFGCLSRLAMNVPWAANLALMAQISPTPADQVMLYSRRSFYTGIGQFIWSASNVALIAFYQKISSDTTGYTLTMLTGAAAMCIGYFLHFFMSKGYETEAGGSAKKASAPKGKNSAGDMVRNLAQNPMFLAFLIGDFGAFMANFLYTGTVVYLFRYVVENMNMMSITMTAMSIATIATSFVAPPLAKRLSARTMMLIGCFSAAGVYVLRFLAVGNMMLFVIVSVVTALPVALINITKQSFYADLALVGEYNTGKDVKAFVIGLQTFPLKLGSLVRGVAVTTALGAIGYSANMTPTPEFKTAMSILSLLVPAAGYLFTGVIVLFFVKLTTERMDTIKAELAARKAAQAGSAE